MSLYRVLLADDEKEIRDGIIRKIDWQAAGFELVGAAENGQEALELAERLKPDVLMTDVKMPFMNGLELGEAIAERMPSTKLVFFSGFDDFEYAQRAIKMNATEYILKPINSTELVELLKKIKKQIDTEIAEKRNLEILRDHYTRSLPILREQFLARLIEGKASIERIDELSGQYEIDLTAECWAVAILHADITGDNENTAFKNQSELIPLSLKRIADENLSKFCNFRSFIYSDDVAIITMLKSKNQIMGLVDVMNRICKLSKRFLELSVSAGVGSICDKITNLRYSYQGARSAVDYRVLMGDKAIYIDDMEPDATMQLQFNEEDQRALLNAIKLETPENIKKTVDRLIGRFSDSRLPLNQYQIYLTEMLSELLKAARAYKLDTYEVFGKDFKGYSHLPDYESLSDLVNWFYEVCNKISILIKRERMDSAKMIAEKTKAFVKENFANSDVSVEMLCSYLHVSPAYFSTIFKRETGVSFITYLTNIRMEEAINLLNSTDDKTYVISIKVGYTEPNYFSYVFKKHFGVSPSKFRGN